MRHISKWIGVVGVVMALLLGACGFDSDHSAEQAPLLELIRDGNEGFSRAEAIYRSVDEAMPDQFYSIDGAEPHSVADLYIRGAVIRVEEGVGMFWTFDEEADIETREIVEFGHREAIVNTIHVTVVPDHVVTDGVVEVLDKEVTFGLALAGTVDVDAIAEAFADQKVAALLYEPSPVFEYQKGLWAVLEDGALLGIVGKDGTTVAFEAHESDSDSYEGDDDQAEVVRTQLADLERSRLGDAPIEVSEGTDGEWIRR